MNQGDLFGPMQPSFDGRHCPHCGQLVKLYKRAITSSMAAWLVLVTHKYSIEPRWYSIAEPWSLKTNRGTGDVAKLAHWGFIRSKEKEPDSKSGAKFSGLWVPTAEGMAFARGETKARRHVLLFDSRSYGFDGELVSIRDAIGNDFDYDKLMRGEQ